MWSGSVEVELNARTILKHAKADCVFPADGFLIGIDAHIEVIVEEIVVGAERTISAAQHVGAVGHLRLSVVLPHVL